MLKRFSRRALYELVWSKPMREAAAENGISDVGLVKVCRGAAIPTPPQGHWNKVRAGKRTFQVDLPPRPPGVPDEVTFGGSHYGGWAGYRAEPEGDEEADPPTPPVFEEELDSVLERIRKSVVRVSLPKTLASPQPLIGRLLDADEARRRQQLERSYSWDAPIFDSPFEKRRLKVLNAIFVALSHEGYKPSIQGKEARDLSVSIGKHQVSFDLDGASHKKRENWRYENRPLPKFAPDEKLRLEISRPIQVPGMQWSWVDGEQKLESDLTQIVICLIFAGEIRYREHMQQSYEWDIKRQQERREERRKRKEESERQERLRLEREERARIESLFQESKNLRRAREIRQYVAAVRAAAGSELALVGPRLESWASWATALADQLDPLQPARLVEKFGGDSESA